MEEPDIHPPGAPCPQCGGAFVVDPAQLPERKIDGVKRTIQFPDAAARYAERALEKAEKFGLIHTCVLCGYKARFKVADAPAPDAADAGHDDAAAGGKTARQRKAS